LRSWASSAAAIPNMSHTMSTVVTVWYR
jgi:hypothetical protein